ncbi:MAG: protoporphyrinogen oxidase [Roseiflexaceae bacterium]
MKQHEQLSDGEQAAHVVIIGGGITGLSSLYTLEQAARAAGIALRCTLIERDQRLGGKILTERVQLEGQSFLVEGGPDSFVAQKPWAAELAREIGLGGALHGSEPAKHATYVLHRGQPKPLPEGTLLIVPTKFMPFALSPLISPLGKLRMAFDFVLPARSGDQDESLADFIRRRLGREVLDRLAEPLMSGIHSAECERQSLLATFPRFHDTEKRYGSLIRGMIAARAAAAKRPAAETTPFMTLRGGIGSLITALRERISSPLLLGRSVRQIRPGEVAGQHVVDLDDGTRLVADAVVVTTPAYTAADLLSELSPALANALRELRYVSTATVTLGFPENAIRSDLAGYGVIIPRSEKRSINACTISSRKFAGRAPAGSALVRAFLGGSRTPEALALSDDALLNMVRRELREILGIQASPQFARIYRWERGNPQYDVGHLERIAAIEALQPQGIILAGAAYRGVGIPDCIKQGREAANSALQQIRQIAASHAIAATAVVE